MYLWPWLWLSLRFGRRSGFASLCGPGLCCIARFLILILITNSIVLLFSVLLLRGRSDHRDLVFIMVKIWQRCATVSLVFIKTHDRTMAWAGNFPQFGLHQAQAGNCPQFMTSEGFMVWLGGFPNHCHCLVVQGDGSPHSCKGLTLWVSPSTLHETRYSSPGASSSTIFVRWTSDWSFTIARKSSGSEGPLVSLLQSGPALFSSPKSSLSTIISSLIISHYQYLHIPVLNGLISPLLIELKNFE